MGRGARDRRAGREGGRSEGGAGGGKIIATGTPEDIARKVASHTGESLAEALKIKRRKSVQKVVDKQAALGPLLRMGNDDSEVGGGTKGSLKKNGIPKSITIRGAAQHNLQQIDVAARSPKLDRLIARCMRNSFCMQAPSLLDRHSH